MLITLVFAEAFLLELTQSDLRGKNFDVDAEKLIALLNDVLNDFVVVQGHEEMETTVTAIGQHDAALDVLNSYEKNESIDSTSSMRAVVNTFDITYDPIDIFVVVACKDGVGGRIELIQRARRDLKRYRELHARPMVLACIKALQIARAFSKVFMEL